MLSYNREHVFLRAPPAGGVKRPCRCAKVTRFLLLKGKSNNLVLLLHRSVPLRESNKILITQEQK